MKGKEKTFKELKKVAMYNLKNQGLSHKQSQKGITLVALVVTIIVLLILAGVTIMTLFGENGLISMADKARRETENSQANDIAGMGSLIDSMDEALGIEKEYDISDESFKTGFAEKNKKLKDAQGNIVKLPKGFKLATDSGATVQEGIVIEDSAENQFVWIPVGTVNIIKDGKTESVNIELARYDFTTSDSTVTNSRTPKQSASNYTTNTAFTPTGKDYEFTEYATRANPDGLVDNSNHKNDLNAIAKDLKGFVDSVKTNGGYYIARYEASTEEKDNTKPASKYNKTTWTSITQINAALASRKMYLNNKDVNGKDVGVESDLINSYAWDTAIIYIEQMNKDNKNYANIAQGGDSPTSKLNTGKHNDEVCKIHDMSGNVYELSTEYSSGTSGSLAIPCVIRGGFYSNSNVYTAFRGGGDVAGSSDGIGFRPLLYVK